jgi:hypothetical protein
MSLLAQRVRPGLFLVLLCLTYLVPVSSARSEERYYLLVFGSQSFPKIPRYTHTWATAVRATIDDQTRQVCRVEVFTISWYPATLRIRPWDLRPEPGVNLDLHDTIRLVLHHKEEVAMWGPYEIPQELFTRYVAQKLRLESGVMQYQTIDPIRLCSNVCDCIHAVADVDPISDWRRYPLGRGGEIASQQIVNELHCRGRVLNPGQNNDWLLAALGLNQYPLVRRQFVPGPLSAVIVRGRMP